MLTTALLLALVGFAAGFIDAIAGGGGLLTLPALLTAGLPVDQALGTNKGQSPFGTLTSLVRYWRAGLIDKKRALASAVPAAIGSGIGVLLVTAIDPKILTPIVMVLLAAVAIFMIFYRRPKVAPDPRKRHAGIAIAVAGLIGMYDGFFGPGTGIFLIVAYAYLWRDPLDHASANAKVANFASNVTALVVFSMKGAIVWTYALPMAVGQIAGSLIGAQMTIKRGTKVVRIAAVVVSLTLLVRLAWQWV